MHGYLQGNSRTRNTVYEADVSLKVSANTLGTGFCDGFAVDPAVTQDACNQAVSRRNPIPRLSTSGGRENGAYPGFERIKLLLVLAAKLMAVSP